MQAAGTNSFRVPRPLSVVLGAMDCHIEHHLFPRMPNHRLRQMAPEVERICREHGIPYRRESFWRTWSTACLHAARLSFPTAEERAMLRSARS